MYTFTLFGKVLRQFDVKAYFLRELNEIVTCMTARRDWLVFLFSPTLFSSFYVVSGKNGESCLYLDRIHLQNSIAMSGFSENS
jgi:hypothetical protein